MKSTFNQFCTVPVRLPNHRVRSQISVGNSLPRATFTSKFSIIGQYSSSPTRSSFCEIVAVVVIEVWAGTLIDRDAYMHVHWFVKREAAAACDSWLPGILLFSML
jgi:hypothetical protein